MKGIKYGEAMSIAFMELVVKSRTIIRFTMKQLRVLGMPLFHRLDGWLCIEGGLRQVMVVQADVAAQCLFEIQA